MRRSGCRGAAVLVGLSLAVVMVVAAAPAAAEGLWNDVARAPAEEAARQRRQTQAGAVGGGRRSDAPGARAEDRLRYAVRVAPGDFEARRALAEHFSATGRPRDAAREFAAARRLAPSPADEARTWFRIANERSRLGAYHDALDAYARQRALAQVDSATLSNTAELSMAVGRLDDAIAWYREAVAIDERESDRRDRLQGLALGYFGLAVALDRADRPVAAREALARALAFDPGLSVLRLAEQGDGDLFFVPPGDVFYYLGLARAAQGRTDDATAAFRNYLRVATGPYGDRARAHLRRLAGRQEPDADGGAARATLPSPASLPVAPAPEGGRRMRLRVVHQATLSSAGPIVAPLIDAAWRLDRRLLDDCLSDVEVAADAPGGVTPWPPSEFRLSVDLQLDGAGKPSAVVAQAPAGLAAAFVACVETAVRTRLRVTRPARHKPTRARVELVLAPAGPSG
ncbi:MAG: tetratricopeptide repeat protein [Pseudomonadota bacterium]